MSSRRSIDCRRAALLLLAAFGLVGCGAGPAPQDEAGADEQPAMVPPVVQTDFERAASMMAAGELDEAEDRFRQFLDRHPGYPGAHVNLAILLSSRGDDEAAERHIAAALELDSGYAPALNQLGMLRRRQGRFAAAESAYLKAVTATPEYALAHYNLGVLNELYLQRFEPALRCYERYLDLGGDDEQVSRWVVDLKRRLAATGSTANAREQG
jgi:Flp pilus assembly protein TadD